MSSDALLQSVWDSAVVPALVLLPQAMSTAPAYQMILAAGLQESGLRRRVQVLAGGAPGPAHGLWQNERGGVSCVLANPVTRDHARRICVARGVAADPMSVWQRMVTDDILAAAFARLLLWADPKRLPERAQQDQGWALYLDAWNPGKPRLADWAANWARAGQFVYGS